MPDNKEIPNQKHFWLHVLFFQQKLIERIPELSGNSFIKLHILRAIARPIQVALFIRPNRKILVVHIKVSSTTGSYFNIFARALQGHNLCHKQPPDFEYKSHPYCNSVLLVIQGVSASWVHQFLAYTESTNAI